MQRPETIDVVIRFHDAQRLAELERAVFSLAMQRYRPINIVLVTQRFTEEVIEETRGYLSAVLSIKDAPTLKIVNFSEPEPRDARSILINVGIQHATGRYLAFLDYDDCLYPEAYELLVSRVRDTDAAIAFGGITLHYLDMFPAFSFRTGAALPFKGRGIFDLFEDNFCPIHSFVIDRTKLTMQELYFEPYMCRAEDYDFLLRVCAQHLSDFTLCGTIIGAYNFKNDGSNTTLTESATTEDARRSWADANVFLEGRRRTMPLAAVVQRSLGLQPDPNLTIRGLLDRGREALPLKLVKA